MNPPSYLSKIQLTQCYHCFDWCHKRNECPKINDPVICSHCAGTGHNYLDCREPLKCNNCDNPHAATYKGCPSHQVALLQVLQEINDHHSNSNYNSTFNSTNNNDILKAARLASSTPTEFAEQLFNATSTLINIPESPSPSLAFGCELDVSIEDIVDDQDQAHAIPPQTDKPVIAIYPPNNPPLVRRGYIIDNAKVEEQHLKLIDDILYTNEGPQPYTMDTYKNPKIGYLEIKYNFDQIAQAWIAIQLDREAGVIKLQGCNFKPDSVEYDAKFQVLLDLAQISPPITKQNELSIQCPFTNQTYKINYYKNWDYSKGPPSKQTMKKGKDNNSPKEIEKWINNLITEYQSKRYDPIKGLNYFKQD